MGNQGSPPASEAAQIKEIVAEAINQAFTERLEGANFHEIIKKALQTGEVTQAIGRVAQAAADKAIQTRLATLGKPVFTGGDMLSHARSLFEYHAGQRLTSIRYFVIVFSAFAGAYFAILATPDKGYFHYLVLAIISLGAAFATDVFRRLDRRNRELVEIDELALLELEELVGTAYPALPDGSAARTSKNWGLLEGRAKEKNAPLHPFHITHNADLGFLPGMSSRYGTVLPRLFWTMLALSILAMVPPLLWILGLLETLMAWLLIQGLGASC